MHNLFEENFSFAKMTIIRNVHPTDKHFNCSMNNPRCRSHKTPESLNKIQFRFFNVHIFRKLTRKPKIWNFFFFLKVVLIKKQTH